MTTDAPGSESTPPEASAATRRAAIVPSSPADWVLIAIALAIFGYGVWRVIDRGSGLIAFGAMALAFVVLPYRTAGVIGGAGLIALGVRECVIFGSVTILGGILIVIGALTLVDKLRRD